MHQAERLLSGHVVAALSVYALLRTVVLAEALMQTKLIQEQGYNNQHKGA